MTYLVRDLMSKGMTQRLAARAVRPTRRRAAAWARMSQERKAPYTERAAIKLSDPAFAAIVTRASSSGGHDYQAYTDIIGFGFFLAERPINEDFGVLVALDIARSAWMGMGSEQKAP